MSYHHTVAPRYSLNRKYPLSHVFSTVKVNMHTYTSFSTSTVQSRIWMSLLLLLSLAIRLWSQHPAPDQDTRPKELRRANSTDVHTSTSFHSFILETTRRPGPHARKFISCLMRDADNPAAGHQGHLVSYPKCAPQCHLQTTHSRRYVISGDQCHSQFIFCASCWLLQVPSQRECTPRFQSQVYYSRDMWPCCDYTSPDDDEHNTDNNPLLLFPDADITPTLLEGLSEVDCSTHSPRLQIRPRHFHDFAAIIPPHLITRHFLSTPSSSHSQDWCHTPWKGTHTPSLTLCWQTSRLHSVNCSHVDLHHSRICRFE